MISGPWLAPEDGYMREIASIFEKATGAEVEYGGWIALSNKLLLILKLDILLILHHFLSGLAAKWQQ